MKKPKRRSEEEEEEEEDRLSELPDSVIFLILSFLSMIDVVQTTILSKRWRNLWTTTPFLNFDYDSWRTSRSRKYGGFERWVNHFLFRWNGVRILELRVCSGIGHLLSSDIEMWVEFAIAKGVENLYLHGNYRAECWVPKCLFSCSSLKLLSMKNCIWRNDGIVVQWNKLKKLEITDGVEVTEALTSQILSGSPLLEVFELSFLDKGHNLNIRSNSLKKLSIHKHLSDSQDSDSEDSDSDSDSQDSDSEDSDSQDSDSDSDSEDSDSEYISMVSASELTIWTPNLETLQIKGIPFGKCGLIHVPSSTCVTVGFSGLFTCVGDSWGRTPSWVIDFIKGRFDQILETIQHVESVELICSCFQLLGAMKHEKHIYSKVKSLVVSRRSYDYKVFIGALKVFSQLSRLVLEWYDASSDKKACSFRAANLPKSFQLQLRTVDIAWCDSKGDDDIFPFIEFLLKYADKLEKMVFRVLEASPSTNYLLLASQKLVRMPRSSPTCTILTIPF